MSIRKVAHEAGVSATAVSYALSGKSGVSKETRSRVLEIAKKVGYNTEGHRLRKSMDKKTIRSIAFVSCLPFSPWGEHYYGQILKGCINVAQYSEIVLQVAEINNNTSLPIDLPSIICKGMADGFVVVGWPSKELVDSFLELTKFLVFVDIRNVFDGIHHIRPDNCGGTVKSVNYLYDRGHRNIGVIAGDMNFDCEYERLFAYQMAMAQLGLPNNESWVVKGGIQGEVSGYEGMKKLVKQSPEITAVLCHGDLIARGAIAAAHELNIAVPKDISIMGFDNQPISSKTNPPLTTIDISLENLGRVAVDRLVELSRQTQEVLPLKITLETKLIERASVASPRKP